MRSLLPLLLLATASCVSSVGLAPPQLSTRNGPAAHRTIRRVVALPATCGGMVPPRNPAMVGASYAGPCPKNSLKGADQTIRASLEFQGLSVIDSEKVNAVTASRQEVEIDTSGGPTTTETETHGSLFEDATPNEQNEILRELAADGVLNARVFIGSAMGIGHRRTVIMQVRLRAVEDGALVWARRCELEVDGATSDLEAAAQGAKCALEGPR